MFQTEHLQEKWQKSLSTQGVPKIEDGTIVKLLQLS